ncbi:MAG: YggT family protein [Spirochaetales bacterium]|nr:YggT family protein [Spirochaetales bacterium]
MELVKGICGFAAMILGLYSTLILIRIIVSWAVLIKRRGGWNAGPYYNAEQGENGSVLESADTILGKLCDPYLNIFKGVKSLRRSVLDLTPVLALVVLNMVKSILSLISKVQDVTIWMVLAIIIQGLWSSLISFLLILLIVVLIVRFFLGKSNSGEVNNIINALDPILDAPVGRVYKLFFRKAKVDDQKLVLASIIFYVVIYVGLKIGIDALVKFLVNL